MHTAFVGKVVVYAPGEDLGFSEMCLPGHRSWPGDVNQRRSPLAIRDGAETRAREYGPRKDAGAGDLRCIETAAQWLRDIAPCLQQPWALVVNVTNPRFPHFVQSDRWDLCSGAGDMPPYGPEQT